MAPVSLRKGIESLIKREIKHAKNGKQGIIKAKMNSLVDPNIIKLLYEASSNGVKIDLLVRGMCCLYPKRKGLSENITVISIVGRFLEHSRIYWFANNGKAEALKGYNDDLVMSLAIGLWIRETALRLHEENLRVTRDTMAKMDGNSGVYKFEEEDDYGWEQRVGDKKESLTWLI